MSNLCKATAWNRFQEYASAPKCTRKATRDGWCWQHHPDAVAKRKKAREARARLKRDAARRGYQRMAISVVCGMLRCQGEEELARRVAQVLDRVRTEV